MPVIPGTKCITATHYVQSIRRIMSFTTYWEPAAAVPDLPTLVTIATDMQANLSVAKAGPMMSGDVVLPCTHVHYQDSSAVDMDAYSPASSSGVGGIAEGVGANPGEDILPDIVALVIQKRTGLPGRQHRGRIFVPGIDESLQDDGRLNDTGAGLADALAAYIGADRTFGGIVMSARHWNRKDNTFDVVVDMRYRVDLASRRDRIIPGLHLAY